VEEKKKAQNNFTQKVRREGYVLSLISQGRFRGLLGNEKGFVREGRNDFSSPHGVGEGVYLG